VSFSDQQVVDGLGALTSETRRDHRTRGEVGLGGRIEFRRDLIVEPSFDISLEGNASNQNRYDADFGKAISGFYGYRQVGLHPAVTGVLGDPRLPVRTRLQVSLSRRTYGQRPTRDVDGSYREGSLRQDRLEVGLEVDHPLSPKLSIVTKIRYGRARSNTDFQRYYSYDAVTSHYLVGFRLGF